MTTINPTYILIDKPYVAAGMRARAVAQGRDITNATVTAEQTAAIIEREVGRLLQLALAAAQIPGVTPASGSVYAQAAPTATANATAVRSELATELARVDVAVSSRLATAGYTAPGSAGPTVDEIRLAVWQHVIESGISAEKIVRIMSASLAGTSQKAGSTITFKGIDGVTDRIIGSFDAENNRTGSIVDGN